MKSQDKSSPNPSTKNQQPKNLQQAVQSTISSFLSQRQSTNSDIALDIYRAIKDEAHLLLEGQKIHDALDADPFELTRVDIDTSLSSAALSLGSGNEEDSGNSAVSNNEQDDAGIIEKSKNGEVISRLKKILRVISCTRTTTLDGYSSINAIVQLDNDGNMDQSSVNENIRLHFTFLREPQKRNNNDIGEEGGMDTGEKEMGCCSSDKCGKIECDDVQLCGGNNNNNNNASSKIAADHHPAKRRKMISKDEENGDNDAVKDGEKESNKSDDKQGDGLVPKTIITYRIDYSVDYGKMEPLLGVDVYALGDIPSVELAVPMFDDGDDDDDDENVGEGDEECAGSSSEDTNEVNDDTCCKRKECGKKNQSNHAEFEDIEISDNDDDNGNTDIKNGGDGGDRFGVYINPENVVAFLDRANMNLNEQSVFYLLLTFPFYEHEWDISGFLLSALFDDECDDEEEEQDESGDVNGCKTSCCSGGQSSCCDG